MKKFKACTLLVSLSISFGVAAATNATAATNTATASYPVLATISPETGKPAVPGAVAATKYKFLGGTWDATKTTITVGIAGPDSAPKTRAVKVLPSALQQLANATGNTYKILNLSNFTAPVRAKQACATNAAEILIIVGDSSYGPLSASDTDAGGHGVTTNSNTNAKINCSVIVINSTATWSNLDFDPANKSVGHTVLHELGHAMGLDHPDDGGNVMRNAVLMVNGKAASDQFTNTYSTGDLYGLYQKTKALRK